MKDYNPELTYLIVKKYACVLLGCVRRGDVSARQAMRLLGGYMRTLGFPREVVILAVLAYLALL